MARGFTIQMKGADAVAATLKALVALVPQVVGDALEAESEIEMTEAKRRTPWDTGNLRASGHVQPAKVGGGEVKVTMGFGGPAAPYALFVHEDTEVLHKHGEAKFLESTLRESAPYMAERIATRVKAKLGT